MLHPFEAQPPGWNAWLTQVRPPVLAANLAQAFVAQRTERPVSTGGCRRFESCRGCAWGMGIPRTGRCGPPGHRPLNGQGKEEMHEEGTLLLERPLVIDGEDGCTAWTTTGSIDHLCVCSNSQKGHSGQHVCGTCGETW